MDWSRRLKPRFKVLYKGVTVGDYQADIFVNNCVIVELKVAKEIQKADEPQLLNELKARESRSVS